MQNFPNNIVPTSLYCNKYYTRCASACQCPSDGRSLTGQSTVPSTRVWRITSATRKTLWRLRAAATPSSATMGPRERSSGHHFCGGAAETDGTVHRSLSCTSDIKATPISQKAECPADMYPLYWTPSRGGIIMRYTYEYKRKCVELYREGKWPETPEGVSDKSFRDKVRLWVRAEDSRGPEALKHKNFNRNWTPEERLELVSQVMSGKSCVSVAIEAGIQDRLWSLYHGWFGTLADCKKTDGKKNSYSGCLLCEQGQNNQCHKERFSLRLGFFYDCRHHGPLA